MNERKILWSKEWLEEEGKNVVQKKKGMEEMEKEKWLYKKRMENTWGAKVFPAELTTLNLTQIRTVF